MSLGTLMLAPDWFMELSNLLNATELQSIVRGQEMVTVVATSPVLCCWSAHAMAQTDGTISLDFTLTDYLPSGFPGTPACWPYFDSPYTLILDRLSTEHIQECLGYVLSETSYNIYEEITSSQRPVSTMTRDMVFLANIDYPAVWPFGLVGTFLRS